MEEQQRTPTEPPAAGLPPPGGDPPAEKTDIAGAMTFLFTDIEGSTRLWETYPEAMREARARHEALLRQVIAAHGGSVFNTGGDSLCSAFAGAESALAAALAGQQALLAETWGAMEPLRVRMALHTGAAERHAHDYFGPTLNRITRLLNAGHGGQTLLSGETAARVRAALPEGAALRELGTHRLKDLQQPLEIFQLLHPDLPADFPPLRSLEAFAHNLPRQPTRFIGREAQMAEIQALLARSPLLTLTGPGGCGKTRLALQVAADRIEEYPDGVWQVELAALADPGLVIQTAAAALGIREQPGRPLLETILDYLRPRSLLLILDNCEHLLTARASLVRALLRACPRGRVLPTRREALAVSGEQTYPIPSLSLPPVESAGDSARSGGQPAPDTLSPTPYILMGFEAVRLFHDRAVLHQAHFALTGENAGAVAEVCRRLDGIPLAIELAAALVNLLTVSEIARGLDDRFRLLHEGSQNALPRQQTLRALIDWSYDLLSEAERRLLCRLSVFAGGWTLEAAEAICAGGETDEFEVLELMGRLVEKSLVLADEAAGGEKRYRLLETIREYGREKHEQTREAADARARHRDWYLRLAEEAEPQLQGPAQRVWIERLELEHDNLRAAADYYVLRGETEEGLRLVGALAEFWHTRGYLTEGRERLAQLLAVSEGHRAPSEARTMSGTRAKALYRIGMLSSVAGDSQSARPLLMHGLEIARELNIRPMIAWALTWLATEDCLQGNYSAARPLLDECLPIFRDLNDERGISYTLDWLGHTASFQGNYAAAHAFLEEALDVGRRRGDRHDVAWTLVFYGVLFYQEGHLDRAEQLLEEARAISSELGLRPALVWSLIWLAYVSLRQGDPTRTRSLCEEGLTVARQLGIRLGTAYLLDAQGRACLAMGNKRAARSHCAESLLMAREIGAQTNIADCLESLASMEAAERAARLLGAAAALREAISVPVPRCSRPAYDSMLDGVRSALGEERFRQAWSEGAEMPLEDAIAVGLETTRPT